ncbi:MAG: ThuA domain-containing protein [Sphingobacteriales bacterium]|nr:ThuA domain-containing protein [Sphingobacteriales bacterium]OJY81867.1 MAG: Crp/Fnr family transcriptional regulator [Sphingobacteriales bacterium 44-15]
MKKLLLQLFPVILILFLFSCNKRSGNPRVLVFAKTAGFHHESIAVGIPAIQKLGQENGFDVDSTTDASMFNEDTLKKYSAVVFLNTTGPLLNTHERIALERYIQSGGGYMGIHAAADAEYDWGWYNRLVGAYFLSHPRQQEAKLIVKDKTHPSTKHLPDVWTRKDEWYNFKKLNKDVHVLISIDEKSYEGGKNGDDHPMTWYHDYDGGRAFYTELGHTDESYSDPLYLQHILGGIQYAIGDNNNLNYSKATAQYPPDEDRFTKTPLIQGEFFEPTEMTILPNFDILITQRRGEIMLYKNETKTLKQVGFLHAYFKTSDGKANAEEGVLGISKDPNFSKNHWVYIFYSPIDTSVNRLSRFTFENDTIDVKSEKVVLQFYSQREICCHTGGSVAFGPDGLLYVSAGDNTTPFNEPGQTYTSKGYGPIDDRPGHLQYDARRSSGNTNDLRGKILRIRIKDDGTYEIPDGNLFPKGMDSTRPEIYVMGNRNPYRISVDQKNSFLYWGEVGPDAGEDSIGVRGPRGYDELNQARKAGYFGWPLFVGNNYPYNRYDYATGQSGPTFDPEHPVNESRNNTGLRNLPPVAPAFIWYPYAPSADFPQVGTGGRNAMAGPVYYTDMFPKETRYPDYYNDKLFIYDWIRGWMKVITMLPNGDFDMMEPFMEHTKFHNAIDVEVGPDGRLYVLEYGSGWFAKNDDAGLSRIDYNGGNRPPKVTGIKVDQTSGPTPLTIKASVEAKDPENDKLTYVWTTGSGQTKETAEPAVELALDKAGDYAVSVEVKDDKGASAKSDVVNVYAGNTAPQVSVQVSGNQQFYFAGRPVSYTVMIHDKEDGENVDDRNLYVTADYMEGKDKASMPQGHQTAVAAMNGKTTMLSLDCKTCHKIDEKSIGPAFTEVAKRYQKDQKATGYLTNKIIKGGGGVWGETAMAAHPDLAESDAKQIVQWILTLADQSSLKKSLPARGSIPVKEAKTDEALYISATYADKGGSGIKALTGSGAAVLFSSKFNLSDVTRMEKYSKVKLGGNQVMVAPAENAWFAIDSLDLQDVTGAELTIGWRDAPAGAYIFELRLGAPDGKKLGEAVLNAPGNSSQKTAKLRMLFNTIQEKGKQDLYIVSRAKDASAKNQVGVVSIELLAK